MGEILSCMYSTVVFVYSSRYSSQSAIKLELSKQVFKNTQIRNFIKISSARAELFLAVRQTHRRRDGRTDKTRRS